MSAAQKQLEQEMQQQEEQGTLLHGTMMADFSRLEAEANAKTSKAKAQLDSLTTTQRVSSWLVLCTSSSCDSCGVLLETNQPRDDKC